MTKAHVQYSPLRRQEDFREMQQDISQTQVRYKECCLGLPSGFPLVRLMLCSSTAVAANTESIVGYYAFSFQFSGELKGSSTWPSMASHQQRLRCCLSWSTARAGMLRSIQVPTPRNWSSLQSMLGRGSNNQNGNLRWHLPWKGGGSRGGLECHIPILKNDFC